jgi:hypothetical protein
MSQSNTNRDEALSALEVLGFVRKTSEKIIENSKEIQKLLWNLLLKALKTYKIKFKKTDCMYKLCTFDAFLFCGSVALAQVNEQSRIPQNWFYRKSSNPQSVLSAYTYDPVTDRYIYTNSVDGFPLIIQ